MRLQSLLEPTASAPVSESPHSNSNSVKLPPISSASPSNLRASNIRQTASASNQQLTGSSKARASKPSPKQSAPFESNSKDKQQEIQPKTAKTARPLALLSCSHVFHARCLDALERLTACDRPGAEQTGGAAGAAASTAFLAAARPICPVCRAVYVRKPDSKTL